MARVTHISPQPPKAEPGLSDAALVAAALRREAWAAEALFRRHADAANGLAFRLLGRDNELDDVVQDAYLIVLDQLHRLKDPQSFAAFLATVIVRRVRRLLRRRRFARALGLMPAAEPADPTGCIAQLAPADAVVELRSLYRAVERLPTNERLALLLRHIEKLPFDQIASMCGYSLATVKRRLSAAEARLAAWGAFVEEDAARGAAQDDSPLAGHIAERRAP